MAAVAADSNSNAASAFYAGMKLPIQNRVDTHGEGLPVDRADLASADVPVGEVLFEIGAIVASHLLVALCVIVALRFAGILVAR